MRPAIRNSLLAGLLLAAAVRPSQANYSISNNLGGTPGGVEVASGSSYLTAGFATGPTGGQLAAVTLRLANTSALATDRAEVDIYTDGGLQPGSLVGTLTPSGAYSSSPAATTFTAAGITLASGTNYWVVLKALSGTFAWSWDRDNAGTGAGYQGTWGESDDAGATWFTYDSYATQMDVEMASAAAVPEPSTWSLWTAAIGCVVATDAARRGRRAGPTPG